MAPLGCWEIVDMAVLTVIIAGAYLVAVLGLTVFLIARAVFQ